MNNNDHKYKLTVEDPCGIKRKFEIWADLPIQNFRRGDWNVTITALKRNNKIRIDKIEWDEICPICKSDLGHFVNCPNGICFIK